MLTILRNISPYAIPVPFDFLEYKVTFLYRMSFSAGTVAYHFDPVASWRFDPPFTYLDTRRSKNILEADLNTGVISIYEMLARNFTIERGRGFDTIEWR